MRLLTWNLEFAPVGSRRALAIRAQIARHDPDVVCLTETHTTWPMERGHWLWADGDYGYPEKAGRRKVGLWSRTPWTDGDTVGHPDLPKGRFIAGVTDTELGPVKVMGVCIPWRMAHVSTGRRDREPWQDHMAYLSALGGLIATSAGQGALVVAGDFNQRVPRRYTPTAVHAALLDAFAPLTIVTGGPIDGLDSQLIDHIAIGPTLGSATPTGISRFDGDRRLSDHDGVVAHLDGI